MTDVAYLLQEPNGAASNGDVSVRRERSVNFSDNVEYVVEQLDVKDDPAFEGFSDIFAKFQVSTDLSEVRLSPPSRERMPG